MRLHCWSTNITLIVIVIRLIGGHDCLLLGYAVACCWCNKTYNQQSIKKNNY